MSSRVLEVRQQSSQLVSELEGVGKRDGNLGGKLDTLFEPRTRPAAEGIGMEQKEVQSGVKRYRGYD